jgi:spermidine synthase
LFLVSFATLYVEIMLIRWMGTEVRVFAYFQNLALIACFLGFGLGCYRSKRRKSVLLSLVAMAALVVLVHAPIDRWHDFLTLLSTTLGLLPDADLWGFFSGFHAEAILPLFAASVVVVTIFLLLLVAVMVPLGQWVGFYLEAASNPIRAYSVNLLGSVAGVWVFAGLALLWLPPQSWFSLAFLCVLLIRPTSWRVALAGFVLLCGILFLLPSSLTEAVATFWSPYQKLQVMSLGDRQYQIYVNNTGYMRIANMTADFLARNPDIAQSYHDQSSYDTPFRFAPERDRILIVGAGAGNDAAAALRNGAGQVDAVEIDPVILSLGENLHPDQPYRSARVRKILADARAFLRQAQEQYDVILFGLLDSHTQFSDFSNMRIDNYVYTEEAFREARRLLKPNGIMVVKFEVREPWTWMGQRFYAMLDRVFGRSPLVLFAPQIGELLAATIFITSDDAGLWKRAAEPELAARITEFPTRFPLDVSGAPLATTDDWPYAYHRSRSIPGTFLTVSLILLGMAVVLVGGVIEPSRASTWNFFFLGAGFLLLETQLISRLALYFGTTWLVNCVALTAILMVLVLANVYVARRPPKRLGPYYALLVVSLFANYFFPWQRLPYGAWTVGVLLSAAYSFSVFFAGVIFTERFRRAAGRSSAFGANIVGAVAGGLAQNVSFILGMKMLLVIAALFYASAGLFGSFGDRRAVAE